MGQGPGLYRTCKVCGNEYKASRPACPNCGKPPFTKRSAYAVTGPKLMVLIAFFFFVVWAAYGFLLSPDQYERYRAILFGLPRIVSQIGGTLGAVVLLGVTLFMFLGKREPAPKRSAGKKTAAKGPGEGGKP